MEIIWILLTAWNLVSFALMGIDKSRARNGKWRISEAALLGSAFLLGAPGAIIGSRVFHHKTKKLKFTILLPLALLENVLVVCWYFGVI